MKDLLTMYQVYTFPFSEILDRVANKKCKDKMLSPTLERESKKKDSKIRREPGKKTSTIMHAKFYKFLQKTTPHTTGDALLPLTWQTEESPSST